MKGEDLHGVIGEIEARGGVPGIWLSANLALEARRAMSIVLGTIVRNNEFKILIMSQTLDIKKLIRIELMPVI
jgi:hypothetical protein